MIIYKLGDAFALTLNTVFFLKDLHFTLAQVGLVNKGIGMTASILGGILGGLWMTRLNLYKSLIYFGIAQAIANLSFMILAMIGHHLTAMMVTVFIENFGSGLSNTAFVVLIMNMCNKQFSATQYALFSALATLGRVYVGPIAGVMVEHWGWAWFYFSTFVIALPGVALMPLIKRHLVN
jgi:PAT family beta-lactamase induction signal transducer AmpG